MAYKWVAVCDLCLGDGELRIAVGEYQTGSGHWQVCATHKKEVQMNFKVEDFENKGDLEYIG